MIELITGLLSTAIVAGGVLSLAALGEVMAERAGVVNLGVEGLMAVGALTGIATVFAVPSAALGFAAALVIGALIGSVFAFATVIIRANQILCGLALTLIGTGMTATLGRSYSGMPARAGFEPVVIPYLSEIPIIGPAIFSQNLLVYVIYFILPITLSYLMFRTRHGLNMRAVGENPAAADAVGVNVTAIRFAYVTAGAALAAGAGAYLTLAFVPSWSDGVVAGRGWIAVALVIFAGYRPGLAVLSGLFFGLITAIGFVGQARGWPIAPAFLSTLPYVATIALIMAPVLFSHRLRHKLAAPAALGLPYFRDTR